MRKFDPWPIFFRRMEPQLAVSGWFRRHGHYHHQDVPRLHWFVSQLSQEDAKNSRFAQKHKK
ncbi:hypothetical protein KY290_028248 [Solanum tuberosum]|uniref:Uncharacterized protein n=1 Tax=Solanum tuberosum TaxID=4113 RepID=A0ABQ7UJ83_SOLTU|nr:hypothetical protein KY290_028248 [Solanum tuberosum]